jgi:two-component system chemotaxis sensor kinase CheA
MIVLAVTEAEAFSALVSDYRGFLSRELAELVGRFDEPGAPGELYRRLHTFKGLLAQFSFASSPHCLHEVETRLASQTAWSVQSARQAFAPDLLQAALERDLACVTDALGDDFAPSGRRLVLSQSRLQAMEKIARAVLAGAEGRAVSPPLRLLLHTLAGMGMLDVKAALSMHSRGAAGLAARLEKQLAPITVQGDDVALPPERYGAFFRSLVHLFRNAVDHGLEGPDERLLAGKPADGAIRCDVRDLGDCVEIVVTDDGQGIDRAGLAARLVAGGMDRSVAHALSLEALVFRQGLSSRDVANEVSGRGIGLAAVKTELDRIGGSVSVVSAPGAGARFTFRLPSVAQAAAGQGAVELQRIAG